MSMNPLIESLVVEDEALMRRTVIKRLEASPVGFQVVGEAKNGREALKLIRLLQPKVVFSDVYMPVMDGLEAAKTIRRMARRDAQSVPIIAMTANAFDEDTKKSIESGMNGHLAKPVDIQELLRAIQEVL